MIYFSFLFCSDCNLEATVVKTDEITGLKQLFTPVFSQLQKKFFSKIMNNYRIVYQKNHEKNNNDRAFNLQQP